ncbi:MAG: class II aldolase/adducin family protein [Rubrivivax sp.]|nr:class II aldolase/adducin family protein [Rubrivivax sp.]
MTEELEMKQRELKQQIVDITNELFAVDIITATGGNISGRIPGTDIIWITPTKMFKGGLTVDDLIRVDLQGNMVEGKTKPSIEAPLHTGIYREREDVLAVVHSHAPYATAIALCNMCFPPITFDGYFISKLPTVPFAISGQELAEAVLQHIGAWPGAFLQNHGFLALGKDLRTAANLTLSVEHMGKVLMIAKILGGDVQLPTLPQSLLEALDGMAAEVMKMVF